MVNRKIVWLSYRCTAHDYTLQKKTQTTSFIKPAPRIFVAWNF